MDELGAVEVGPVFGARQGERPDDERHRDQHRIGERLETGFRIDRIGELVRDERQRETEQRRGPEVDPDLGERLRCHGRWRRRINARIVSAVVTMATMVLATSAARMASHSSASRVT